MHVPCTKNTRRRLQIFHTNISAPDCMRLRARTRHSAHQLEGCSKQSRCQVAQQNCCLQVDCRLSCCLLATVLPGSCPQRQYSLLCCRASAQKHGQACEPCCRQSRASMERLLGIAVQHCRARLPPSADHGSHRLDLAAHCVCLRRGRTSCWDKQQLLARGRLQQALLRAPLATWHCLGPSHCCKPPPRPLVSAQSCRHALQARHHMGSRLRSCGCVARHR